MPVVHEVTTYTFEELSAEAQEKAIEAHRDWNVQHINWWDITEEEFIEDLKPYGVYNVDMRFSGFWSQGDGASFTGSVDLAAWMKSQKIAGKYRSLYNAAAAHDVYAAIDRGSSNYTHEYTIAANVDVNNYDLSETAFAQGAGVEELLTEWAREQSKAIYKELEQEYDWLTSDEAVRDNLIANELEFTEDGERW